MIENIAGRMVNGNRTAYRQLRIIPRTFIFLLSIVSLPPVKRKGNPESHCESVAFRSESGVKIDRGYETWLFKNDDGSKSKGEIKEIQFCVEPGDELSHIQQKHRD